MKRLEFKDGDRVFTCCAEASPATPETLWWWVTVTGESARYAAFRADPADTAPTLRPRILAYYEQLLADRARPATFRPHWSQRRPGAPTKDAGGGSDDAGQPRRS